MTSKRILNVALSYEGSKVAIQFGFENARSSIGVFDIKTHGLFMIDNPPGWEIGFPSFSTDGKHMVVGIGYRSQAGIDVGIVDMQTMSIHRLTEDGARLNTIRSGLLFRPQSSEILYIVQDINPVSQFGIRSIDYLSRVESVILPTNEGFRRTITWPSALSKNDIIFQAISPLSLKLQSDYKRLGLQNVALVAFQLNIGGRPELLYPNLEQRRRQRFDYEVSSLCADLGSHKLYGLTHVLNGSTAGPYKYDVVRINQPDSLEKLTDIGQYMTGLCVAGNGKVAAFLTKSDREEATMLAILDTNERGIQMIRL